MKHAASTRWTPPLCRALSFSTLSAARCAAARAHSSSAGHYISKTKCHQSLPTTTTGGGLDLLPIAETLVQSTNAPSHKVTSITCLAPPNFYQAFGNKCAGTLMENWASVSLIPNQATAVSKIVADLTVTARTQPTVEALQTCCKEVVDECPAAQWGGVCVCVCGGCLIIKVTDIVHH